MNVQWRKMGRLAFVTGGVASLCLMVASAFAQSADDDQYAPPAASRTSSRRVSPSNSADGWHDRSADDGDATESQPTQAPTANPPSRPAEAPRAGSPGYAPSYQQPQPNPNRQPANRPPVDPRYRQSGNSAQNAQNADPRRTGRPTNQMSQAPYYPNPQAGSTAGPYYGYPPAHARTVAYNRQDIEYADDQPHMSGGPGQSVMSGGMPQGYMQAGAPPGDWNGSEEGGCANGNCSSGGCSDGSCSSCGGCDGDCCFGRNACRMFGDWFRADAFRDLTVLAGVQGFKDPTDLGENGDFGFHYGSNWGMPLWGCSGVGVQMGFEFDHSDLAPNATVFGDHRNQYFLTGGAFYRATHDCGLQGGIVWDYLDDEFYDSDKVSQLRGNLSYVFDCNEIGFQFAAGVHSETTGRVRDEEGRETVYDPTDIYTFYYGRRLCNGGEAKVYAGVANHLGGIVGSNLDIAISDSFSLQGDFCYVIADKVTGFEAIPGESANLSFSLVWHPGCHARDTFDSEYRPLFNVANNSSFIVNRTTKD